MTVALGVSAYSAAIFHLMTHAFFKALLFLGAGSVIIALHHEQDLRRMGGLRKYMPITYVTAVIGSLALAGIPPFAGFFSKDAIIEAVQLSHVGGTRFRVVRRAGRRVRHGVLLVPDAVPGVPWQRALPPRPCGDDEHATPGTTRMRTTRRRRPARSRMPHGHAGGPPRESPWVVTVPLILLAMPSIYAGWAYIEPMLFGDWFGDSIFVREPHAVVAEMKDEWHGAVPFILHGLASAPFWLAIAGIAAAVYLYLINPALPARIAARFRGIYTLLDNKYYFDRFNDWFFAGGARAGSAVSRRTSATGRSSTARWSTARRGSSASSSREFRRIQSGYVYHYAFVMIVGVFGLLYWWGVR